MARKPTIPETFDEQYRVDKRTGCFVWLRACKGKEVARGGGYGCFRVKGVMTAAHRFAYERAYGTVPKGKQVMHLCDNTKCVNPKHLKAGTNRENAADAAKKLRKRNRLTPANVRDIRRRVARGESQASVAPRYGLHQADVHHIVHRHYWTHVT